MKRVAIALALAACGSSKDAPPKPESASGTASAPAAAQPSFRSTGAGSVYADLPGTRTIEDAVKAAIHGAPGFDARPQITGAFADRDGKKGGAAFTAMVGGKPVKGSVLVGIDDKGATAAITFADAPTTPQLQTTSLAGGSGTVGVPSGWTLTSSTQFGNAVIDGPERQRVLLGASFEIVEPGSTSAQMLEQSGQAGKFFIVPFESPDKALVSMMPKLNRMNAAAGQPTEDIDQVLSVSPIPASTPGGIAVDMVVATTRHEHGDTPFKSRIDMESIRVGNGGWMLYISAIVTAPAAIYDRDEGTMIATVASWKLDDRVVAANTRTAIDQQNRRFDAMERSIQAEQSAFEDYLHSVQASSDAVERSNDDFDEMIRGVRAVEDSTTGERTYVDLGNVTDVVERMNEADPGRYHEIPLRDE